MNNCNLISVYVFWNWLTEGSIDYLKLKIGWEQVLYVWLFQNIVIIYFFNNKKEFPFFYRLSTWLCNESVRSPHPHQSVFFLNKTIAYMEMLELLIFWCNHLGMVACIMYSMFNKLTSSDEGPIIVLVASVALV